jgi:ADP-heptose:LPS heptosyltransferase
MKILIVRFSSIGDIVLTTPVIRCLKQQVPGVELHYLTKSAYVSLIKENPYIDKIHSIDKSIDEVMTSLKEEKYDQIIDLHHNLRTKSLKRKLGVPTYAFPKENINKWILVNFKIDKMPDVHIVDRYMQTVDHLNVKNDLKGIDYFIPKKDLVDLTEHNIPHSFFCMAIGGQFATKKMPKEKMLELIDKIDTPIVIIGGKEDVAEAEYLTEQSNRSIINLAGQLNLNQSASVLEQSSLLITHDTGMMHIASAFNKPTISIWGNTVPQLGMYSYQPSTPENVVIIEKEGLKCRPCSKIGYQKCPKKHFSCMDHDTSDIVEKIKLFR